MRHLQFYIHDVELLDTNGRWLPFRFAAAAPWQSERVALIALAGDTPAGSNAAVRGTLASRSGETYSGIRFSVGVPFELNHANPLTAGPPLDRGELFWTWQSGYKFLRADLGDAGREWSFHLGSTGCSSASAMRPPTTSCAQPNVMRIEIRDVDPLSSTVRLRVDELMSSMRAAEYAICTGDYLHNPACADVYRKTGLEPQSGACPGGTCTDQRLWLASDVSTSPLVGEVARSAGEGAGRIPVGLYDPGE